MISLRKIKDISEFKTGMITLSVDWHNNESLEQVTRIDNGKIWTKGLYDNLETDGENLDEYLANYQDVLELVIGYNPEPFKKELNMFNFQVNGIYEIKRREGYRKFII